MKEVVGDHRLAEGTPTETFKPRWQILSPARINLAKETCFVSLNTALGNGPNAEHCAWNELEMIFSTEAQVLASCPQSSADKISPELKWFSQVVDVRPRDSLKNCYRPARDTRCLERGELGRKGGIDDFFFTQPPFGLLCSNGFCKSLENLL